MKEIKRYLPIFLILLGMITAYFFGLADYLTYEALKEHRSWLLEKVDAYPILFPLTYIVVYTVSVALSIPGATILTLLGGFLFPQPIATFIVVTSATMGAILIFLAAKTALGDALKERTGAVLNKIKKGVEEDGVYYLLFLRLVPAFPFWLVNLAPAFVGVTLWTFSWTTFLGIIPGSFVYTQAGRGLGAILESDQGLTLGAIFNTEMKIALVVLGIFALVPIVIKKWKKRKQDA